MEFWEESFIEKQTMWGFEPTYAATLAKDLFLDNGVKKILIPGIGYGRNAKIFIENGIDVKGIEISQEAIKLARQNGLAIEISHGSVDGMPYTEEKFDAIFCHALLHLLNEKERHHFIQACYDQLKPGGYLALTTVSNKAPMYGKGRELSPNYFEMPYGVNLYFYEEATIQKDFETYQSIQASLIPDKAGANKQSWYILCQK